MEPIEILHAELIAGPDCRAARVWVEFFQIEFIEDCPVVIPGDADRIERAQPFDARVRVGSIADSVTQAPDAIKCAGVSQNGFQRDKVRVNVGDDEDAHSCLGVFYHKTGK